MFNTDYFSSVTNRINAATSCAELQSLVNEIWPSLQGVLDAINAQSALLQPIEALLAAPGADLTALATWIQNFITAFLTPYYKPYAILATQLSDLTAQITALTAAVASAEARFLNCSITIPSIT